MRTAAPSASLGRDLRLELRDDGILDLGPRSGPQSTVAGRENLIQALTVRLIVGRGELGTVGHQRYGSRVAELIGEPLTTANLALLRRHVRAALNDDPRVEAILDLEVRPRRDEPGSVDVLAKVRASTGDAVEVTLALDLN